MAVDSKSRPNIVFLHAHNTGRQIQPYGHAVPTPNLQRLAREGVLFRQAFAAAPSCSPSRIAFMTGLMPHRLDMLGLAHRGFGRTMYPQHLANRLSEAGYLSVQCGIEHTVRRQGGAGHYNGYARHLAPLDNDGSLAGPQAACAFLREPDRADRPFFLSVGVRQTHSPFPEPEPQTHPFEDERYVLPPAGLPDTPLTRREMASFIRSAAQMDDAFGAILDTLDATKLSENTLVFAFSDHGLQFPLHMANTTDRGLGVYLIARGPGGFVGGKVVDALVSLLDLAPTCLTLAGLSCERLDGASLLPLVQGRVTELHDALFAEQTFHAAYEPQRSIRTRRYRYVRRFDQRDKPVLPNIDEGLSKQQLLELGWHDKSLAQEMLFDLALDRDECHNLADDPSMSRIRENLSQQLERWMIEQGDPLYPTGVIAPPAGAQFNHPDDPDCLCKPQVAE